MTRGVRSVVNLLSALAMLLPAGPAIAAQLLYVSPAGNDAWSGRLPAPSAQGNDGPFASMARARDAIRQMKARQGGLREAVTVQIRGGTYRLAEPITMTSEDSGTKQCPISYAAYPGESPVLSGAREIAGWKPWRGQIQCVPLPDVKAGTWFFRSLFADGERQVRARYPNRDPLDPCRKGFLHTRRGTERCTIGGMHNAGDTLHYELNVPAAGDYVVWLRYSHGMRLFKLTDMGGHTSLSVDGGPRTPLQNLPDTGGWNKYQWSRAATLSLGAGKHGLQWRNDRGGGYGMDVLILSDDPDWKPRGSDWPAAAPGKHLIVVEAEDFRRARAPQLAFGLADSEPLSKGEKHVFPYGPGDVKPSWAKSPEAEIHIWPAFEACRGYKQITRLVKIDEQNRTVTLGGPECVTQLGTGDRYFVENVLEELDSPGEWYLDRRAGVLYYWPKQPLGKVKVTAPVAGRLVQFEGDDAKGRTLSHVRLSGLTFTETDYSPDDGCVGYSTGKDGVVYLRGAVCCAIENCRFASVGKNAVYLEGGRENVLSGNDVAHGAEGGFSLRKSSANVVTDNHIHHLGEVYKHVGGVITGGSDNVVSHNLIHDTTRWAITLGPTGTGTLVEHNDVYNTSLETYDTGGIMAYQDDRRFNCQATIRYNLVHDGVGYSSMMGRPMFDSRGIYIDGFSSGYTITHNICYRNSASGGIFIQGGHDIVVRNNICADNGGPQYLHTNFMNNGANLEFTRNILSSSNAKTALMWIYRGGEKLTRFDRNAYWHPNGDFCHPAAATFAAWQKLGCDANSIVADPLFVDPKSGDYSLKPDSPALKLGFEPIDAGKIGLLHKRCRCSRQPVPWGIAK